MHAAAAACRRRYLLNLFRAEFCLQDMGKSIRRHRKHKPKIIKRHKKKPHVKSSVPQELVVNAAEIKEKLGIE